MSTKGGHDGSQSSTELLVNHVSDFPSLGMDSRYVGRKGDDSLCFTDAGDGYLDQGFERFPGIFHREPSPRATYIMMVLRHSCANNYNILTA